jgi:NADPH-dependent methylglyoxal reductase
MIYGPALQESATSPETLNTSSAAIYQLFSGKLQAIPDDRLPLFCDVRGTLLRLHLKNLKLISCPTDVAKAFVLALETDGADNMRVPLFGGAFLWKEASISYMVVSSSEHFH